MKKQVGLLFIVFIIFIILSLLSEHIQAKDITATPSKTKISVNGNTFDIETYSVNGSQYFKLRDIAYLLKGTKCKFNITNDKVSKTIKILCNKSYKSVGGEMTFGKVMSKKVSENRTTVYKDEFPLNIKSYLINGNIYFTIMDIARMFDFNVTNDNKKVMIDTNKEFLELLPRYCEAMNYGGMLWSEKDQCWRGVDAFGNMPAGWMKVADNDIRLFYSFNGDTPQLVCEMNVISDGRFYFLEDKLVYSKEYNGINIPLDKDGGISPADLQKVLGDDYKDFVDKNTFTLTPSVGYPEQRKSEEDSILYRISIGEEGIRLNACDTYQIKANLTPKASSAVKIKYSSSDQSVAFVDDTGIIYGIKEGSCNISVEIDDRSDIAAAIISVTVKGAQPSNKVNSGCVLFDYTDDEVISRFTDSTVNSAKEDKSSWLGYVNTFSYISMEPVKIGDIAPALNRYSFRNLNENEFKRLVSLTHEKGMKFVAMNQILYGEMMNLYITEEAWHSWELFWQQTQDFYTKFGNFICDKSFELEKNPGEEINAFWDDWFSGYEEIMIPYAQMCEKYDVDMLVLGEFQLNHTYRGNEERWRLLVSKIRQVYDGKIGAICNVFEEKPELNELETNQFIDSLDYIVVRLNEPFCKVPNPTVKEYKAQLEDFFDRELDGVYDKYGKKMIILASYKSVENAGVQAPFEVGKMQPDFKRDFAVQAIMYEALLEAVSDEEWLEAVWSSGYTWMEEYELGNGALCALDKGHSVRNKPAAEIIKKWSK